MTEDSLDTIRSGMSRGVAWMLFQKLAERLLSLVSVSILARLLVPSDFGLGALSQGSPVRPGVSVRAREASRDIAAGDDSPRVRAPELLGARRGKHGRHMHRSGAELRAASVSAAALVRRVRRTDAIFEVAAGREH